MEVKINKDIREFTETIFFGLSMRQFIFSILACIVAVILYFLLKPYFQIETLSWVCILGATPFATLGFVKYNGMTAEQFLVSWIKCKFIYPAHFCFIAKNYYYESNKENIEKSLKKSILKIRRRKGENIKQTNKTRQGKV